jgi:hypothetical protein
MNTIEFHKTTTRELKSIQDRIRNLVPNWLEDGMYKEAVLRGLIRSFLPKNFEVASGYVARQTAERGTHRVSQQIDIIIYDNNYPVLFKKEELVVVTADSVRGIIEVKSSDQSENLSETLLKCNKKGQFIWEGKQNKDVPLYNGIFYYNLNRNTDEQLRKYLQKDSQRNSDVNPVNSFIVDHISFGEDKFYKFWKNQIVNEYRNYLYLTQDLSFSFFISNLISYLQPSSVANNNFLWFPVDKGFEERILWNF